MHEKVKVIKDRSDVMNNNNNVIIPNVGFGFLKFGMSIKDVENYLDRPEDMENPDELGDIMYYYKEKGINFLSFSKDDDFRLTMIELNIKSNAILWDTKIFDQSLAKIKKLSMFRGYSLKFEDSITDEDTNECFESHYTIEEIGLDFYFNGFNILEDIGLGVRFNEYDEIEWPE
jgi:hypothetical protein